MGASFVSISVFSSQEIQIFSEPTIKYLSLFFC